MSTNKVKNPQAKVLSTYELMQKYPDEQSAIDYLTAILWPNGAVCPYCQSKRITERTVAKNYYRCKVVKETDNKTLQGTIKKSVTTGSMVCTDEHRSYEGLEGNEIVLGRLEKPFT